MPALDGTAQPQTLAVTQAAGSRHGLLDQGGGLSNLLTAITTLLNRILAGL